MRKLVAGISLIVLLMAPDALAKTASYEVRSRFISSGSSEARAFVSNAPYYEQYRNVTVFGHDEPTVMMIAQHTAKIFIAIADDLAIDVTKRDAVPVGVFVMGDTLWRSYGMHTNIAAMYKPGRNEIFVRLTRGSLSSVLNDLAHEVTHCVLDQNQGTLPKWFSEGLSSYESCAAMNGGLPRTQYVSGSDVINYLEHTSGWLEMLVNNDGQQMNSSIFYELSYQVVRHIARQKGLAEFSRYYVRQGADFITAYRTGVSYDITTLNAIERELTAGIERVIE